MLLTLRIENFALIDQLDLDFGPGLTVLTGETGAGKSIILDAIELILGGKPTHRIRRAGTNRTLLEASFQLDATLKAWLRATEIEPLEDEVLICSRELSSPQGHLRSRSRINGVVVNKQQIEGLRDRLVDITAQGQAVQLGRPSLQRDWLDGFGGTPVLEQRHRVAVAFSQFQQAQQALEHYRQTEQQRLQQIDLLEYQLGELQQANLSSATEQTQLEQEVQRLNHSVELQQQSYQVYQALYEQAHGHACGDLLGQAVAILTEMSGYDPQIHPILDMVEQALTQVQEAGRQINAYGATLDTDPQQLQQIEERLVHLKQICRKYGPTLEDAIAYQERIDTELTQLTSAEQSLDILEQTYQTTEATLLQACTQLTQIRQTAAQELELRLLRELQPLAMDNVQFQVNLDSIPATTHGADRVEFMFSPNPGEPLHPLTETASGGEMSRFLLALKACFSQVDPVGTLVFDEIDVGVSGRVAQAIAQKLHHLSQDHQVLCVTHQPIVAAMAHHHFRVDKQVIDQMPPVASTAPVLNHDSDHPPQPIERTIVRVTALDAEQRRQELAQIAGGDTAEGVLTFVDSLLRQAMIQHQHQTPEPPDAPTGQPVPKRGRSKRSQRSK